MAVQGPEPTEQTWRRTAQAHLEPWPQERPVRLEAGETIGRWMKRQLSGWHPMSREVKLRILLHCGLLLEAE